MRLYSFADDKSRLTVFALDDDGVRRFVYSTCVP
jgi:hypothetical protein